MVKTLRPFHNNYSKELTKKSKYYFCDTGLRNYAIGNFTELRFRPDKDQLFENELTFEQGKALIDDLAGFGVPVLLFPGGNPWSAKTCRSWQLMP